jgi:hypothetical protein
MTVTISNDRLKQADYLFLLDCFNKQLSHHQVTKAAAYTDLWRVGKN